MDSLFSTPIEDHLGRVEKIARDAGHAIMEAYKKAIEVSYKSDSSPLTEADLHANRIIVDALKKDYPGIPILTEEAVHDFKGPAMRASTGLSIPWMAPRNLLSGTVNSRSTSPSF